jgi:protocatechuate 3,4-dioxygenase beta subunit
MNHAAGHEHDDLHDRGLAFDLSTLLRRRGMLGLLAAAGLATIVGCTDNSADTDPHPAPNAGGTPDGSGGTGSGDASCAEIPTETAGPFPGDGSNGPNMLAQSGIVRGDITRSFGATSGVAAGVPLAINLTVVDSGRSCAAYAGAAVYLWHCDRNGRYSLYSPGVTGENYLRGVQAADAAGRVSFASIFPGAYAGRWPHIHFEVYPNLAAAAAAKSKIITSQLALPDAACRTVFATTGYEDSVRNHARTTLASDSVFGDDGARRQLATVTGSVSAGYVASLTVPV